MCASIFLPPIARVLVQPTPPTFPLVVAPPLLSIDQHLSGEQTEKPFVTTDFSSRPTIPSGCALPPAPLATPSPLTAASEDRKSVV